jgi:replication initiation protein RepC
MGSLTPIRSSGTRRYDGFSAIAERLADQFQAQGEVSPTRLLGKLKRAAPYMGLPRTIVGLMDELIAHTRKQDWMPGKTPIVWVRNEKLAITLGIGVRQLQNLIRAAVEHGLIVPRDSANGHRGGQRNANGDIVWAYGFDLRPLGSREEEFEAIARKGAAEDAEIDRLRRALASARRRARMLADTVDRYALQEVDAEREMDLVLMAVRHISGSRNMDLLIRCVAQLDMRVRAFQAAVDVALQARISVENPDNGDDLSVDNSPKGAVNCVHITTTTQLITAEAVTGRGFAKARNEGSDITLLAPLSKVEQDLDRHGVDPGFVAKVCPFLVHDLVPGPRAWGRLVSIAEQLVGQNQIHVHAWREACRLMGQRGAAAAVIATVQKHWSGEVRSPGAYLRGMSDKAAAGTLNLGKTYHGLRDAASASVQ